MASNSVMTGRLYSKVNVVLDQVRPLRCDPLLSCEANVVSPFSSFPLLQATIYEPDPFDPAYCNIQTVTSTLAAITVTEATTLAATSYITSYIPTTLISLSTYTDQLPACVLPPSFFPRGRR